MLSSGRPEFDYRGWDKWLRERLRGGVNGYPPTHTTVRRWVQCYATELEQTLSPRAETQQQIVESDETYVRAKGKWAYLYRTPWIPAGPPLISCCLLTATRLPPSACSGLLCAPRSSAAPGDQRGLESILSEGGFRTEGGGKSGPALSLSRPAIRPFHGAQRKIEGYEAVHMIRKGQVRWLPKGG